MCAAAGALALIAAFLVTTVGIGFPWRGAADAIGLTGRGAADATFGPPLARHVFQAPFSSGLKDARVRITSHDGMSPDGHSEGLMVFSPSRAMQLQIFSVDGSRVPLEQTIDANGINYAQFRDSQWSHLGNAWFADNVSSPPFAGTGWAESNAPEQLRVAGLDGLGNDAAWHLTDSGGSHWWIRVRDGYPLRIVRHSGDLIVTYLFDRYNSGATIHVPPDSAVATRLVDGHVSNALRGPGVAVTVTEVKEVTPPGVGRSRPAPRRVAAYLAVTNTSARPLTFDGVMTATDTEGHDFPSDSSASGQSALSQGEIGSGQSVLGWVTFEVPAGTQGLTLRILTPTDEPDRDCLFSVKLEPLAR